MKKAIVFTVVSIPLLILVVYLLKGRSPFGGENTSFAPDPAKEITGIEFTDSQNKLILEKKGEEWFVNKKFETRKSSILFILKILTEMEIKSPVTPELFTKEILVKGTIPVKVKVFGKGKMIKSFLVYKTTSNTYGNIMKLKSGSKPYIVYVPGSEAEIGSAFTLNDLFWRPYTVFNLLPSEIYSVTLENMTDTALSFKIKNENRILSLSTLTRELTGWDTSRVIRYVTYFTQIPFESWAFDLSADEKENITKGIPLYRITVFSSAGEKKILSLWERSVSEEGGEKKDTDRLWGKTDGNDELFILRYTDIDPLLKKRSYFFPG
jgi:hypothetical protein